MLLESPLRTLARGLFQAILGRSFKFYDVAISGHCRSKTFRYIKGMKTPICPNCSKSPKLSFWERQMMSTFGGKSCNNCQIALVPSKWESWLVLPMMFISIGGGQYLSEKFNLWIMVFGIVVFCLVYIYLMHMLLPLKVQPKSNF